MENTDGKYCSPYFLRKTNCKPFTMAANDNWISKKVQGWVAGVGNAAGGAVNAVGNGVSGVGKGMGNGVSNTTRGWADGVRG